MQRIHQNLPAFSAKSLLNASGAALILVLLICVFPWVYVTWGGRTFLTEILANPSLLFSHDDGHLAVSILSLVGVLAWCVLVYSVVVEVWHGLRSRRDTPQEPASGIRILGFSRALVRPLVSAILALFFLGGSLQASADPGPIPQSVHVETFFDDTETADTSPSTPPAVYEVQAGDSLWAIAEKIYGHGDQWPRIAEANQELLCYGIDLIHVGWSLTIPGENLSPSQGDEELALPTFDESPSPDAVLEAPGLHDTPEVYAEVLPGAHQGETLELLSAETPDDESTIVTPATIGISTALAGGMALMVTRRRMGQLRQRPVGRRLVHGKPEGQRFAAALAQVAAQNTSPDVLARLSSLVSDEPHHGPGEAEECDDLVISEYQAGLDSLVLSGDGVAVSIGADDSGLPVVEEVSGDTPFLVSGERRRDLTHVMCGIAMNLAVEERLGVMDVHVVTTEDLFETFENVESHDTFHHGLASLQEISATRRHFLGDDQWSELKKDPCHQEAWRPVVYVFIDPLTYSQYVTLQDSLRGPELGVVALVPMLSRDFSTTQLQAHLTLESADHATVNSQNIYVHPHQLQPSDGLTEVLHISATSETTPAWWSTSELPEGLICDETPQAITSTRPALTSERRPDNMDSSTMNIESELSCLTSTDHPTLNMLGPIQLEGTRGDPPLRAERSCMEYCGWILEHPGTTAMAMAQGLMVSEGTRRSNMSRLRAWLGRDMSGKSYLPEAYTGRIWLDSGVSSDWSQMLTLVVDGIENTNTEDLMSALRLVRGAPLADATPGQWHWAEELRTDMISLIRDIGVVVVNRCLETNNIESARWAATRALWAAPEDEKLLCSRLLTEYAAGNRLEVERLASWISRNARNFGVDVSEETSTILQHVLTGAGAPPSWLLAESLRI